MKLKYLFWILLLFTNLSYSQAIDMSAGKPVPIGENEAVALFFERNLDLIAAHYNLDQAQAQEIVAAAIPNPQLSVGVLELSERADFRSRVGGRGPAYNVGLSQLLETAGKRDLRMESSRLGREAVEADFKDVVRVLSNTVRHAYYEFLRSQKAWEVASDNAERYRQTVKANKLRLASGDIAEADLLRVEVERYKAEAEVDTALAVLSKARAALALLLAWPKESMFFEAVAQWSDKGGEFVTLSQSEMVDRAMAARPDLKSAQLHADQAEKDLQLARRLTIPDVTVSAGYAHDPSNNVLDTAGIGISVPLPLFYQYKGEIGKAVTAFNSAKLQVDQLRQVIQNDVVTSMVALNSASKIVDRFERDVTQRLQKMRTAAEFAYAQGSASLLELLDAERSYKSMMLDYYSALTDRALAQADMLKSLGEDLKK